MQFNTNIDNFVANCINRTFHPITTSRLSNSSQFYTETFNVTTYVQTKPGIDYTHREASQKDRGYLIIFNSTEEIRFTISELTALPGEAESNPIIISSETTKLPNEVAIYRYNYTATHDGKSVISCLSTIRKTSPAAIQKQWL